MSFGAKSFGSSPFADGQPQGIAVFSGTCLSVGSPGSCHGSGQTSSQKERHGGGAPFYYTVLVRGSGYAKAQPGMVRAMGQLGVTGRARMKQAPGRLRAAGFQDLSPDDEEALLALELY